MKAQDILVNSLKMDQMVWNMLLEDMSDADMLVRPVPGANHIAWQIGHFIAAERRFLSAIGKPMPELPADFESMHGKDRSSADEGFLTKDQYLQHFNAARNASIAAATAATDAELAHANTGQMAQFAPTVGDLYALIASHATMHVGQLTVVRRKLGKPVKF